MNDVTFADPVQQAGFTQVPNAVLHNTALSLQARVAYGVLQSIAWRQQEFPNQKKLGEILGVSERSVRTYLAELREANLLVMVRQGLGKTSKYIIVAPTVGPERQPSAVPSGNGLPKKTEDVRTNTQPAPEAVAKKVRPSDPLWDALEIVCGEVTTPMTRSRRGKVAKELRESLNERGITAPEQVEIEVKRRGRRYRELYPNTVLTDIALLSQWDSVAGFKTPAPQHHVEAEPEVEPLPLEQNAERMRDMLKQTGLIGREIT